MYCGEDKGTKLLQKERIMAQGPVTTGECLEYWYKKAGGRFNGVDAVPFKRKRQPESFGAPERVLFNVKVNYFGASAAQGGDLPPAPGSTGALAPCLPGRVACRCTAAVGWEAIFRF